MVRDTIGSAMDSPPVANFEDIQLKIIDGDSVKEQKVTFPSTLLKTGSDEEARSRSQTINWIRKRIGGKECCVYIPSHPEGKCMCGRRESFHRKQSNGNESVDPPTNQVWDSAVHTKRVDTATFGAIEFSHDHYEDQADGWITLRSTDIAQYLRLSDDVHVDDLFTWFESIWSLKLPKLTISFYGGHEGFQLAGKLQNQIQKSLMQILQTIDCWLITDGTNAGLSEIVGLIYSTYGMTYTGKKGACIGMVSWGAINGQRNLIHDSQGGSFTPEEAKLYLIPHPTEPDVIRANYLDKHHSHHLLIDNGSHGIHGNANHLRHQLLKTLTNGNDEQTKPVIMMIVEGGLPIVKDICIGLTSIPKIPVIVVRDSGGLADVFVQLIEYYEEKHYLSVQMKSQVFRGLIKELLLNNIRNIKRYENDIDSYIEKIKTCIEEHGKNIIILDYEVGSGAMQQAILSACKDISTEGIDNHIYINELAVLWEEADIINTTKIPESHKQKMLKKAVLHNRVESVKHLLGAGVNLKKFLLQENCPVDKLYMKAFQKGSVILSLLMTDDEIKETRRKSKKKHQFSMKIVYRIVTKLTDEDFDENQLASGEFPLENLLIWAVLANQPEMARCLFGFCSNSPIVTALMVSRMYRYITRLKRFRTEFDQEILEEKRYFASLAIDLLSIYSKTNEDLARECLTVTHGLWGNKNAMLLGVNMMFRRFIAHATVQKILKDIWRGFYNEHKIMAQQRLIWERRRNINSAQNLYVLMSADAEGLKYKRSIQYSENSDEPERRPRYFTTLFSRMVAGVLFFFLVPRGKFLFHLLIYLVFVSLFCYVVTTKTTLIGHSIAEHLCCGMVVTYLLDELRQIAIVKKQSSSKKFRQWLRSTWNVLDALSIILFGVGYGLRFFDSLLLYGRIVYACDAVIWIIKIFQFYRVSHVLGPYAVMMYRMLEYLMSFVMVLFVVVISYGVFQYTLLYSTSHTGWGVMFKLLFRPFTTVLGEIGVDHKLDDKVTIFGTKKDEAVLETVSIVGMCLYLLISNILLINLVIAVFNNIYNDVAANADTIWKSERYDMIMEFKDKPVLPPPLSAVENVYVLLKMALKSMRRSCCLERDIDMYTQKALMKEVKEFEKRCFTMYLFSKAEDEKYSIERGLKHIRHRLDANSKTLRGLSEKVNNLLVNPYEENISAVSSPVRKTSPRKPSRDCLVISESVESEG